MKDYVDIVYNDKNRPISSYPDKLAKYLFDKYRHGCIDGSNATF